LNKEVQVMPKKECAPNIWVRVNEALPDNDQRVCVYSPCYTGRDQEMEYQFMYGRDMAKHQTITYWSVVECVPRKDNNTLTIGKLIASLKRFSNKDEVIAHSLWVVTDVINRSSVMGLTLTYVQCERVLSAMQCNQDAEVGLNWGVMEEHIMDVVREETRQCGDDTSDGWLLH
jgi:hypothetical protein